jgi:hypothetical protein
VSDAPSGIEREDAVMRTSYGVVWREGASSLATGKLELLPRGLRLEGLESSREIPYEGVSGIRVGRSADERIGGRPSVVLERRTGTPVTIATVAQPSLVGEIVERLAALQLGAAPARRTAIVVPIKPETRDAVRALLENGPPFDPEKMKGLDRHEVFLTPHEVIFLFDSQLGPDPLEPLLAEPEFWQTAAAWRNHIAGPPRSAEDVYSWTRRDESDDFSYLPTPGPGDSEGGDIF